MKMVPVFQKEANAFVVKHHVHHGEVVGSIFQVALSEKNEKTDKDELIGVAICGRPTAPKINYKEVIEVTRLCVDRIKKRKNACSRLYAVCARIAKEMGYKKITSCVLESETGITLKAAGWFIETQKAGGKHGFNSSGDRVRTNIIPSNLFEQSKLKSPQEFKTRWSKMLNK